MEWGDILMKAGSGKTRAHVYDDFMLAHLGYWTDNGSFHYRGVHDGYENMEEALLALKKGMIEDERIPIRYIQWDDWWMESKGDIPGMLSWEAKPDVFPSGFSDWLGIPLIMYAPEYSGENVWIDQYKWKTVQVPRGSTAIPLDPDFYMDLFQNGTQIGMVTFEQDFLCSFGIGDSGLTNTDVESGSTWLQNMDAAAMSYGINLQLCMPDAYHLLESTRMSSVTNARGTGDNCRIDHWTVKTMGMNSWLFHALGVFASRDNVWTSDAHVEQTGCGNSNFCYEPNAHLDNVVAALSGGPYGIADKLGFANGPLILYSCRTDGWMLRPKWPLAALDFSFTLPAAKGSMLWAAHDDYGPYRWSYVVGVNIGRNVPITPSRLLQGSITDYPADTMVAWEVNVGEIVSKVIVFSEDIPLDFPISKPLDLPEGMNATIHTHYSTAPVLPNGMVILGETNKWATMSFGRVTDMVATTEFVSLQLVGAPAEEITVTYLQTLSSTKTLHVNCTFPSVCEEVDAHGNNICRMEIVCLQQNGCHFRMPSSIDGNEIEKETILEDPNTLLLRATKGGGKVGAMTEENGINLSKVE